MSSLLDLLAPGEDVPEPPKKRTGPNRSRKGARTERMVAKSLDAIPGVRAHRVPGSGSFASTEDADVVVTLPDGRRLLVEAKVRRTSGWKTLDGWLGGCDVLVLQLDQQGVGEQKPEARVFMKWQVFESLIRRQGE